MKHSLKADLVEGLVEGVVESSVCEKADNSALMCETEFILPGLTKFGTCCCRGGSFDPSIQSHAGCCWGHHDDPDCSGPSGFTVP